MLQEENKRRTKVFAAFEAQTRLVEELTSISSLSQEELAHLVGASRVMVNKILNSFADLGYIRIGRKRIAILNRAALHKIAQYEA